MLGSDAAVYVYFTPAQDGSIYTDATSKYRSQSG